MLPLLRDVFQSVGLFNSLSISTAFRLLRKFIFMIQQEDRLAAGNGKADEILLASGAAAGGTEAGPQRRVGGSRLGPGNR